ncbi:MAG TPA: site-2 protease family protein [Ktedonobacterales bacterium]|nr:site-2 protease family protein [Ktedonobacterales bacterium]
MRGSLPIGKIAGVTIEIHFSWLVIFLLLMFSLATSWFPSAAPGVATGWYWGAAALATLCFFASVLAHELSHALVARARGLPVSSITLFIFGGVSNLEREPTSPGVEFQMAFVGPLTSLVLGALALVGAFLLMLVPGHLIALLTAGTLYLAIANLALGVFNLIPGFPLDGGRVLRSILWKTTGSLSTATRWAARVGQGIAYLLMLGGVWIFFLGDVLDGLWMGFIGLFLLQAAHAESTQQQLESAVANLTVRAAMIPAPLGAPPTLSIQQAVDTFILQQGQRLIPVIGDQTDHILIGIVTLRDIRSVPAARWSETTLRQIMTPQGKLVSMQPDQSAEDALRLLATKGLTQAPVLDHGKLIGMFSLTAILDRLTVRQHLGVDTAARAASVRSAVPAQQANPPSPLRKVG